MERNRIIDMAKGIGIILVIIGHTFCSSSYVHQFVYTFHMQLFLFVSGYVMSDKYLKTGISKRIFPLLLYYVEFCIVGAAITLLMPNKVIPLNLNSFLLWVLIWFQPEVFWAGYLWFVIVLAMCIIIFFVVNNIFEKTIMRILSTFVMFSVSMLFNSLNAYTVIGEHGYEDVFKIQTSMAAFLFFELGYISKKLCLTEKLQKKSWFFNLTVLLVGAVGTVLSHYINGDVNIVQVALLPSVDPAIYLLGSFLGILMVLSGVILLDKIVVFRKMMLWYGKNSLQIYLTHIWLIMLYTIVCISVLKIGVDTTTPLTSALGMQIGGNLTSTAALIGVVLICLVEIPITKLYDITLGRLNKYILSKNNSKKQLIK